MIDWKDIGYLLDGNPRQRRAHAVLTAHGVLQELAEFDPILVGTVPIGIDVTGSDLDIICCSADLEAFIERTHALCGRLSDFDARRMVLRGLDSAVVNFTLEDIRIELFAQDVPTTQQHAFRHMVIEHRILHQHGETFRKRVVALKEQGVGTEPAFAQLLGLAGDPYLALLDFAGPDAT